MDRLDAAARLMDAFAARTGLDGGDAERRYLWTDAFAVCNFLALAGSGRSDAGRRARELVARVHDVLGARAGRPGAWLGGVDDAVHRRSPTAAGLRIGKPMPERGANEPFDDSVEWDRDGQYFHYLTRWMHALDRMAEATGEADYHRWAFELSDAAFDAFVQRNRDGRPVRMVWKMSVDLDRPLVPSMGQHDAVDGWLVARQLAASAFADDASRRRLADQAGVYATLARRTDWISADPLGIGGLLAGAWSLWRAERGRDPRAVAALIEPAAAGAERFSRQRLLSADPARRLAFRELGLTVGLHAVQRLDARLQPSEDCDLGERRLLAAVDALRPLTATVERIESTWMNPGNRTHPAWTEHQDINDVMLAASLVPDGYLGPAPDAGTHDQPIEGAWT